MTENERIKEVRKAKALTMEKFGERVGVQKSAISKIEHGENAVSDQIRLAICREFDVNENWLRTGEGDMFVPTTRSQEIADFVGNILKGEEDNFKRRFVSILARLDESEWEFIERKALELFGDTKKD